MPEDNRFKKYIDALDSYANNLSEASNLTTDINKSGEYRCIWYVGIAGYGLLNISQYLEAVLMNSPTGPELLSFSVPWFVAVISGVITLWWYGRLQEKDSQYYISKKGSLSALRLRYMDETGDIKQLLDLIDETDKTSKMHQLHGEVTRIVKRADLFEKLTFGFLGIGFPWAGLGGFLYSRLFF